MGKLSFGELDSIINRKRGEQAEVPEAAAPYIADIDAAADRYGVPREYARRLVQTESNFNPDAVSPAGAQGLMQIVPKWHPNVDPFNSKEAIDYGIRYFRENADRFGQNGEPNWMAGAAAYNAGPGTVERRGMDNLPPETRDYVPKVIGEGQQATPQRKPRLSLSDLDSVINPKEPDGYIKTAAKGFTRGAESIAEGLGSVLEWGGEVAGSETVADIGRNARKYWQEAQQKGWAAPDEAVFGGGDFFDNPSIKRAVGLIAQAVPWLGASLATGGGAAAALTKAGVSAARAALLGGAVGGAALGTAEGAQDYIGAREAGKSVGEASKVGALSSIGTAVLEALPTAKFLRGLKGGIGTRILKGAATEGITEGAQTGWQNLVAKIGYEPTRQLAEGLVDSIIGGAGVGGMAGTVFKHDADADDTIKKANEKINQARAAGATEEDITQARDAIAKDIEKVAEDVAPEAVEEEVEKPVEVTMKDWEDSTKQTGLGDDEVAKEIISKVAYGPIEEKPTEAKRVGDLKTILERGVERGKQELKIPEPLKQGNIPGTEVDIGAQAREIARRKNAEALRSDTGRLYQEGDTGSEGEGREDIQRNAQKGAEAGGAEVSREEVGPLRYDPSVDQHNGEKLTRGDVLTDEEGNRYALDRDSGFILTLTEIDKDGKPKGIKSFSVDPTDTERFKNLYKVGENIYEAPTEKRVYTPTPTPVDTVAGGAEVSREEVGLEGTPEITKDSLPENFVYDENLKHEADVHSNKGKITVGPKFFELSDEAKRQTIAHEVGHELSDKMLKDGSAFDLADKGAFGPKEKDGTIRGINGQYTPGENVSEAFAVLQTEPEWLKKNYPAAYNAIAKRAILEEMPVPAKVRDEFSPPQPAPPEGTTVPKVAPEAPVDQTGKGEAVAKEQSHIDAMPPAAKEGKPVSMGYIQAKKQPDGKWQLFYRGTRNEVFPGEMFNSNAEAKNYYKAIWAKAAAEAPVAPQEPAPGEPQAPVSGTGEAQKQAYLTMSYLRQRVGDGEIIPDEEIAVLEKTQPEMADFAKLANKFNENLKASQAAKEQEKTGLEEIKKSTNELRRHFNIYPETNESGEIAKSDEEIFQSKVNRWVEGKTEKPDMVYGLANGKPISGKNLSKKGADGYRKNAQKLANYYDAPVAFVTIRNVAGIPQNGYFLRLPYSFKGRAKRVGASDEIVLEGIIGSPSSGGKNILEYIVYPKEKKAKPQPANVPETDFGNKGQGAEKVGEEGKEQPAFKRGTEAPGLPKQEVVSITEKISKNWKGAPDFAVHSTQKTLPDPVQAMMGDGDVVKGVLYDGVVHLVAQNLATEQDVIEAIAHEAFGHYGLKVLGERGTMFAYQVYGAKKSAIADILKEPGYDFDVSTREGKIQAADEWLAREAQTNPNSTWVDRAIRLVKGFIRKLGFDVKLSDAEIRAWIADMRHVVVEGKAQAVKWGDARFMVAHHGSPHVWQPEPGFPHGRPRLDKIGTGEGGAAYGWGWYSAEEAGTADKYKKGLTRRQLDLDESVKNLPDEDAKKIYDALSSRGYDVPTEQEVEEWGGYRFLLAEDVASGGNAALNDVLEAASGLGIKIGPEGYLYTLDIPDDVIPKLLDWDGPVTANQRDKIIKQLKKEFPHIGTEKIFKQESRMTFEQYKKEWSDSYTDEQLRAMYDGYSKLSDSDVIEQNTGDIVYGRIAKLLSGVAENEGKNWQQAASEFLARAGIPGNTHGGISQGATGAKYVIWDQAVLDRIALLERNGEKLDAIREEQERVLEQAGDARFSKSGPTFKAVDTESEEFKKWFAGSKVKHPVYHGSTAREDFNEFAVGEDVSTDEDEMYRVGSGADPRTFIGSHFAKEPSVASKFAKGLYGEREGDTGGKVYKAYIAIKNPHKTSDSIMMDEMLRGNYSSASVEAAIQDSVEDIDEGFERYDSDEDFRVEINQQALLDEQNAEEPYFELAREMASNFKAALIEKGYDGVVYDNEIEGGESYIVFNPTQIKSALTNTGEFSSTNPDIRFMRGKAETKSTLDKDGFDLIGKFKDYISPAKLTQKGKDDLRPFLDLILRTPAFFSKKLHATRRLFDLSQIRQDNFHEEVNRIENNEGKNVIKQWNELGKDKKAWKKAADYLLDTDKNQDGFALNFDDGKWLVKNPEGAVLKTFKSEFKDNRDTGEIAAVEFMRKQEAEWLTKNGFTDAQYEAIMAFRIATDKGFDLLISNLRKIQAAYAETEMGKPPVISTFDPDGKPVKVTIQEAIALMGSMRGYYFPRIRIGGRFILRATKEGSDNILEKFTLGGKMNARATELRKQGYKVETSKDVHVGEDVFQMAGDLVKTQQLINAALEKIKSTKEDLSDEDAKAMHEEIETIFTSAVSEQIANVIRQRGSRVYMTKRSKEYWAGYETNPEIALAKYIRGISAGEAKRQMTTGMLRALTGTEVSWKDYQKISEYDGTYETFIADRIIDNPEIVTQEMFDKINDPEGINEIKDAVADLEGMLEGAEGDERKALRKELSERRAELYGRYRDFVKDMMIDQREQPEAFKWAKEYIAENTRNQETADKVIGVFRGLAVGKYLAFRVFSAPIVNLTALPTSTIASMKAAGIPYFKTYGYLTKGIKNYGKFRRGFLKGEEAKVFDHINQQGWDNPQFNSEAMTTLRSAVGKQWDRLIEIGMFTFSESEKLNRAATIAATYYGLRAQNKEASFEDLMKQAKEVSDNSHGIYNKGNYPYLALGRHPAAHIVRMFYVFRTFSHTYLQNMARIGFEEKDYGALAHMVISPAIIAGAGASAMTPLISAILNAFGIDDPEEEAYRKIAELYGSGAEDLARFGLTGKAGISVKGSLAVGIGDMPTTFQDLLGAPGSVVGDLYEAIEYLGRGDISKGVEKGLPTGVGNILRAYREYNEGLTTRTNAPLFYGREQVRPSMAEAFYRGMSFNPARIAKIREKQWNEYKAKDKYREWATDIYAKIKRYYIEGQKDETFMAEILGEIQSYNEGAKRWGFSPITRKTIRANIRRSFKPSKFERERKQ